MRTAISDGLVALLKEYYGRGPERTRTYVSDDLVVCLLRGGSTRVEQTLLEGGHGDWTTTLAPVTTPSQVGGVDLYSLKPNGRSACTTGSPAA